MRTNKFAAAIKHFGCSISITMYECLIESQKPKHKSFHIKQSLEFKFSFFSQLIAFWKCYCTFHYCNLVSTNVPHFLSKYFPPFSSFSKLGKQLHNLYKLFSLPKLLLRRLSTVQGSIRFHSSNPADVQKNKKRRKI